ncbi:hypothetical protein ACIGXM_12690 [Kitasatospora sp. NPDC052896]|uniref:hypothetical protein n=1 Tax=Kitasatospora sp. NPDC052896 TaxID=3364061 RepID=UPI0037C4F238
MNFPEAPGTVAVALAADQQDGPDQRDRLGDGMAVPAGQRRGQPDAVHWSEQLLAVRWSA